MKMRSILTLSLLAFALPSFGGSAKPDDEKAVLAAEKQYADAMVKHDVATLEKILADDLSYTHSSMKQESKADILNAVKAGTTNYKSIDFNTTKVRQYGNTVVTNHNMVFTQPTTASKVYVTMVWIKQGGGWQMVQRQATKLPE